MMTAVDLVALPLLKSSIFVTLEAISNSGFSFLIHRKAAAVGSGAE